MSERFKMNIELDKTDFSEWKHLSPKNIDKIGIYKKHLKKISNLIPFISILLLFTNFIRQYPYSKYVIFVVGVISLISTLYIIFSSIKTKRLIKHILFHKDILKQNSDKLKVKIYKLKVTDRIDVVYYCIVISWAVLVVVGTFI